MQKRVIASAVLLTLFFWLCQVGGFAQEKKTYSKGDVVKVKYVGEVVTGKVVSAKITGSIDVEFVWKGKKMSKSFPLALVEPDGSPAAPAQPTPPVATQSKPIPPPKKPTPAKRVPSQPAQGQSTPEAPGNQEAASLPSGETPEVRTWTSDTGKFKIEASFGGVVDGKVKLIKPDGTPTLIPLEKLSVADRELATNLGSDENPFLENPESEVEDPFQEVTELARPATADTPVKTSPKGSDLVKPLPPSGATKVSVAPVDITSVDWSTVDNISSSLVPAGNLKLEPDVGVEEKLDILDKPYLFGGRSGIRSGKSVPVKRWDKPQSVMIDPVSKQAIVPLFYNWANEDPSLRVVRINLKDGKVTQKLFPSPVMLASFHPATQRFLGHGNRHMRLQIGEANGFGVWVQTGAAFEPQGAWMLDNQEMKVNGIPASAQFAGADHAVVWTERASVSVWSLVEKKPLYVIETGWQSGPPAVSANGKYLGVQGKDGQTLILNLPSGEVLGALPQKNLTSIAFHPQGRYFAAASAQRVLVYDLLVGKIHRDIFLNKSIQSSVWRKELVWLGDGYLLSGNSHLIDIERSTVLWHYDFPGFDHDLPASTFYGGQYWYAIMSDDGEEAGLFHVTLPHAEALEVARTIDGNSIVLKPGAKIRVEVSLSAAPEVQARIRDSISREIVAKGMFVDPGSSLVLTASTSTGKTSTETYQFYGGQANQTVSTTEQICSLRLTQDRQTVWEVQSITGGSAPYSIHLQEGQTAQDYVNASSHPNYQFFYDVEIPSRLAKVPEAGAYGFSQVTKNGVEEAAPPETRAQ